MLREENLDFWVQNRYNVLFAGHAGVGKTSIVKAVFDRHGLNHRYFSASTMDPWVDLVGVPKERIDDNGQAYLDLIRPKGLDEVEAIFFDEFNRCLVGSTPIRLVDGRTVSVESLVGESHFYVYSHDLHSGNVVVGKGHSARRTGVQQPVLSITLDNGEVVRCTGNHPFLLRSGEYKQAADLKPGDSLMPLYTRVSEKSTGLSGYEQVLNSDGKWVFTHRLADDYNLLEGTYTKDLGGVRHHKDFRKSNNSPENIVRMHWRDHWNLHSQHAAAYAADAGKAAHRKHPDLYGRTIGSKEAKRKAILASVKTRRTSVSYKAVRSAISKSINGTQQRRVDQSDLCKNGWKSGQFSFDQKTAHKKRSMTIALVFGKALLESEGELDEKLYNDRRGSIMGRGRRPISLEKIARHFGSFDGFIKDCQSSNHKVVAVVADGMDDVYDITVDQYHNFALGAGVFVHNSHKKVRNACMELLQFKTINGRAFPNLKIIWAAINPDDDETYDVEKLDPAQKDRFHIHVDIPYKADKGYFMAKYGEERGRSAVSWWDDLPEDVQRVVSPRRLDYALDIYSKQGDIRYVLPEESNVSKLLTTLKEGPIPDMIDRLYKAGDLDAARRWITAENNYQAAIEYIRRSEMRSAFFLPLVHPERLATLAAEIPTLRFLIKHCPESESFSKVLGNIYEARQNASAVQEIQKAIDSTQEVAEALGYESNAAYRQWPMGTAVIDPYHTDRPDDSYNKRLDECIKTMANEGGTTTSRSTTYHFIVKYIPAELNVDDALLTLRALDAIAIRSQGATLRKLDKLVGIVNHCIFQIHKNTGLTLSQIVKRHSNNHFRALWRKMRTDKALSAGLINYGKVQAGAA